MLSNVYVYTGNHRSLTGIEDNLNALTSAFAQIDCRVSAINSVPPPDASLCIIIECFCDISLGTLISFYDYLDFHHIPALLIHTEFISPDGSLNQFTGSDWLISKVFGFLPIYFYKLRSTPFFALYACILCLIYPSAFLFGFSLSDFRKLLYWRARGHSLSLFFNRHTYHACLSQDVYNTLIEYFPQASVAFINPPVDLTLIEDKLRSLNTRSPSYILMTGNMTSFRRKFFDKLAETFIFKSLFSVPTKKRPFASLLPTFGKLAPLVAARPALGLYDSSIYVLNPSHKDLVRLEYSITDLPVAPTIYELYIGQTLSWPYHSPMRIIRSLYYGFVPLSVGKYYPSQISALVLEFVDLKDLINNFQYRSRAHLADLLHKLHAYNELACTHNQTVLSSFFIDL